LPTRTACSTSFTSIGVPASARFGQHTSVTRRSFRDCSAAIQSRSGLRGFRGRAALA
jgi:hypothetical protein